MNMQLFQFHRPKPVPQATVFAWRPVETLSKAERAAEHKRQYEREYYARRTMQAKAERINKHNLVITHRTEADVDKIGALTGRGTPNGRDL